MATGTKNKILQEGLRLFREKGYTNVSVEDICASAAVTRSTFYYHYKTKDELLDSVYVGYEGQYSAEELADIFMSGNHWQQLCRIIFPSIDYTAELGHDLLSWLMAIDLTEKRKIFTTERLNAIIALTEKIIHAGQVSGQFRNCGNAKTLADIIIKQLEIGNTFFWCVSEGNFDLIEKIEKDIIVVLDVQPELL